MTYQLERFEDAPLSPEIRLDERQPRRPAYWLRALAARLWTRAALRRLLERRPGEGVHDLPPHLLRDIGLPPDFRPQDGLARSLPPV